VCCVTPASQARRTGVMIMAQNAPRETDPRNTETRNTETRNTEQEFDWAWAEQDDDSTWVPPAIDTSRPSAARMYDYALGGKDNFAVDREAAEGAWQVMPDGPALARANRRFLARALRVMTEAGIRQFIDLGAGIPTSPNVHEVAREGAPDARVVYVDNDPIVLAHNRAILDRSDGVVTILRDVCEPSRVLADHQLRATVDLDEPVGLLMIAVLHFVDLSVGSQVVQHYLNRVPSGSRLAFSVATFDGVEPTVSRHVEEVYRNASSQIVFRSRAQVEELIDGVEVQQPGIVDVSHWDPSLAEPLTMRMHSGIAVKP